VVLVSRFFTTILGVQFEDPPGDRFSLDSNSSVLADVISEGCSIEISERPDPPVKEEDTPPPSPDVAMDQDKPDPPLSENAKGSTTPTSIPAPIPTRETTVLPQVLKASVNEATTTTVGAILEVSTSTDFVAGTTLVLPQVPNPAANEATTTSLLAVPEVSMLLAPPVQLEMESSPPENEAPVASTLNETAIFPRQSETIDDSIRIEATVALPTMMAALAIPAESTTGKRKIDKLDVPKEEIRKPPTVKSKKARQKDDSEQQPFLSLHRYHHYTG
jgi:hypothetical protein